MSMDYYVYLKSLDNFFAEECKKFFLNYDMKADIYPDFDINTQSGFLPFKLELLADDAPLKGKELLTGFEFYLDDYDYETELKELQPRGLKALFKKVKYVYNETIDEKVKQCKYQISLCCGPAAFEVSAALIFAAYLVKNCGGAFYETQINQFILDPEHESFGYFTSVKELNDYYQSAECEVHLFEKWEQQVFTYC